MNKKKHKYILIIALISLILLFSVYCLLSFQIIHVDGKSMQPTLMKGDFALVNCYSYIFRDPQKEDIVLVKRKPTHPSDNINLSIKRITGIHGDTVQFQNATLSSKKDTVTLSEGEYFLVGDNAANSYDSRHYGAVTDSAIIGKVIYIK
jgi:signal peptidase I